MSDPQPLEASDLAAQPPSATPLPANRHWTDAVLSISAIVISAISLWVAIDTNKTNRQLVVEASWPFLQIYASGAGGGNGGQRVLSLNVQNAGVGPAKIETFELFWSEKPYRSSADLMKDCCGYMPGSNRSDAENALGTSEVAGTVLRAGDNVPIIRYVLTTENAATWNAFSAQRFKLNYRVCYCSVFNECWLSNKQSVGDQQNLNPRSVKVCPQPNLPYAE